jgi:hypothetical protein
MVRARLPSVAEGPIQFECCADTTVRCSRAGPQNKEPRRVLALKIEVYDPVTHYQTVRDVWGGVRTPDGR